jgi:thiol-disulfide isomerase/thioredoxin
MLQRHVILLLSFVVLPMLLISFAGNLSEASYLLDEELNSSIIQQTATNFIVQDVDSGSSYYLSDFRGRVVVLDLFATWCPPCKVALPYLRQIYDTYSDNVVQIISIDIDNSESQSLVSKFREDENMDWIVSLDPDGTINAAYGTETIPTFYIIDQQGEIKWSDSGFSEDITWPAMESRIKNLVDGSNGSNNPGSNNSGTGITRGLVILAEVAGGIVGVIGVVYIAYKVRGKISVKKCLSCSTQATSKCAKCGTFICSNCSGNGCPNCKSRQFVRLA